MLRCVSRETGEVRIADAYSKVLETTMHAKIGRLRLTSAAGRWTQRKAVRGEMALQLLMGSEL